MLIDYHRALINLAAAGYTVADIATETGIAEHKLYRIRKGAAYRLDLWEVIALLDLHIDKCPDRHKLLRKSLTIARVACKMKV